MPYLQSYVFAVLLIIVLGAFTIQFTIPNFGINIIQKVPSHRSALFHFYASPNGRLGNLLFNLACTYGLAQTNHKTLVIPPNFLSKIESFINMTHLSWSIPYKTAFPPKTVTFCKFRYATYEEKMKHLGSKDLTLGHHLQSYKYFQPYKSDIQEMMVIRDDLVYQAQSFLQRISCSESKNCTFIALHIRRGDQANHRSNKYGYLLPVRQYLAKAMMYFISKYTGVHFIVCSDDIKWCRNNETHLQPGALQSNYQYSVHFSPGISPAFDLALLVQCNHTIITSGTFGWWAGWLAKGEVIYFNSSIRTGSTLAKDFTAKDYYPPTWLGMDDD